MNEQFLRDFFGMKTGDDVPTLRDRFAMAALNGMLMTSMENAEAEGIESSDALRTIAKAAYEVADVMMEARKA